MCNVVLVMAFQMHKEYPCGLILKKSNLKRSLQNKNAVKHNIQFELIKDTPTTWAIAPYIEAVAKESVVDSLSQEQRKEIFTKMYEVANSTWNRYDSNFNSSEARNLLDKARTKIIEELDRLFK